MALRGVTGPDRVLYGMAALFLSGLKSKIDEYNSKEKATVLLSFPGDKVVFSDDTELKFSTADEVHSIPFSAGEYSYSAIKSIINLSSTPLTVDDFSRHGVFLTADTSVKFLNDFGNLKKNQIINYQPLVEPKTLIISGTVPGEDQLKAFPALLLTLASVNPEPDGIVCSYGVDISLAITSPINSSQTEFMTGLLLKYYDVLRDVIFDDDGSLGGLINGLSIDSASVDEVTGNSNFLKILTISTTCMVEED